MIPDIIFLIPYRNREEHKIIFQEKMEQIIQKYDKNCELYYCFQNDERTFNRGALKNIGFLAMKEKYPDHYQNITFVFNDIDTFPTESHRLDYATEINTVKHFFGFTYTLGGIVSIKGFDFEKILGYPNYWGWGYEDNLLQKRIKTQNILIDRTNFVSVNDKSCGKIVQLLHDNNKRKVNSKDYSYYRTNMSDNITDIYNLNYDIIDNMITIHQFETKYQENIKFLKEHDLTKSPTPFSTRSKMMFT
tara:strand:- start:3116 stop:3856 length:741 start_codon:yes stop_codon:yes gene_type:complete